MANTKYVLIVRYNFDDDTPVYLYDTIEEAKAELKRQVDDELRIQREENENDDIEVTINDDGAYACITFYSGTDWDAVDDTMEWIVSDVRNK